MSRATRLVQRLGLVAGAGLLAAGAAALTQRTDGPVERLTVNTRFAVRGGHPPSDRIVIVAFDNRTLRALHVRPPVPRETQAQVIDRLDLAGAAAIAFDYSLEQSSGDAEADRTLALALMNARRAIVSVTAPEQNGDVADLAGFIPFSDIDVLPGYTPLHLDPEGVVRTFTRPPRGVPTFPLAAARHRGPAPANALIDYPGPAGTFASLSYVDVLHGRFDPAAVRGRIAIVGSTATVLGDAARVPVDSVMPGPEIHAAAIATALDGFPLRTVSQASAWWFAVIAGLAVPLALVLLPRRRRGGGIPLETPGPLTAAALGAGALVAWLAIAQLAFNAGTVVDVVPAVAAIVVAATSAALACELLGRRERRRIRQRFAGADLGLLNRLLAGRAHRRAVSASDIVAGYTIAGRLQMGGMGVVYHAVQDRLDRKVALKLIRPEHALDPRYRRRFVNEVHRTAGLAHPNIVPVVDAGESDGVLFIAMPYIDGPDLAAAGEVLQQRGPSAVVRVLHRVACALDAAHRSGLIHRDVKPANVLLAHTSPEHPVLIDFGVALEAGELGRSRQGTAAYLAPERSDGTGDDQAADVYALTVMLFELLTGKLPFKGTADELREAHRNAPRPSLGPGFPPALDAVIARGMAVAPGERYRSATALTHAAAGVLGVEVVDDAPPPVRRPPPVDDGLAPTLTDAGDPPRRRWWRRPRRGV